MGDEKSAPNQAAQPLNPAPGHHGTQDEDDAGTVTIPDATPPSPDNSN